MKRLVSAALAATVLFAAACTEDVKPVSVSVTIDESSLEGVPTPEDYTVVLTNLSTVEAVSATTENLEASFNVVPGLYSITVSASTTDSGKAYYFSGSLPNAQVSKSGDAFKIEVSAVEAAALVFKEIYYENSKTANGDTYIREQFYEIYNNSEQTVYADGLCIAAVTKYGYDGNPYLFEIENPEKYVFAQQVWQIPGNGTTYPIAPGESFVIAQWATNHAAEGLNPASAIGDLSSAEFEAITKESTTWDGIVITDNPAVNMVNVIAAYTLPQWLCTVGGPAMVIFYPETPLVNENLVAADGLHMGAREIPVEWIVDGVEAIEDETKTQLKILPSSIDAGYIWGKGSYNGESISRKIAETKADGRIVYQDTNNTTNDFVVNAKPMIHRDGTPSPAWNTWKK